ncbi:Acylglycerol kinase, mitochondrial [Liparis tanakae]|uniref:Acylglycerol kinase, mitochondrial n=1 Tax=Liparis tanakae TaxID=230148 RepID=A0A4Z2J6A6_9TELE|nr:Acylglycerol kinase, mitochondrial [Liparis tanakae]
MARVVKVFRTLRNNWKKTTFAVCVLSCGGYWLNGKYCDSVLRREACLVAREFGRQQIAPQERLRKATVILNPAACSGKANKLFEKNAAPLLHLSGVEITIVKTDYEGQAKKLMELMEQTDMLIVAGGDGTLQEVVTGLLRREDQDTVCNIPIGLIPLGTHNSLSPSLHLLSDNKVKDITSATLSILKGETVPLDVLQIKGEKEQPVFALTGLRWGAFRDVAATISKYWYLGPLKTNAAHWFSTLREWPLVREISVSYLAPSLRPLDLNPQKPPRPNLLSRIITRLQNRWSPPVEEPPKEEEPEQWQEEHLSTLELFIQTQNKNPMERGAAGFYNIDNEEYEAMPVEVRLLPRKLRFFISAERREQLLALTHG